MTDTEKDPRRAFNARERAALWILADGHCQMCGTPMGTNFHADHVVAHARGGATDVINGQALCPDCNRRKGTATDPASAPSDPAAASIETAMAVIDESTRHPHAPWSPADAGTVTGARLEDR